MGPKLKLDEDKIAELLIAPSEENCKADNFGDPDKSENEINKECSVNEISKKDVGNELEVTETMSNEKEISGDADSMTKHESENPVSIPKRKPGRKPKQKRGRKSKQGVSPLRVNISEEETTEPRDAEDTEQGMDISESDEPEKSKQNEESAPQEKSPRGSGRRGKKRKDISPAKRGKSVDVASSFIRKFNEMFA